MGSNATAIFGFGIVVPEEEDLPWANNEYQWEWEDWCRDNGVDFLDVEHHGISCMEYDNNRTFLFIKGYCLNVDDYNLPVEFDYENLFITKDLINAFKRFCLQYLKIDQDPKWILGCRYG